MTDTNQDYGTFVALSIIKLYGWMDGWMDGNLANEKPLLLVSEHELFRLFLVLELF